jgi:hypothetical protein
MRQPGYAAHGQGQGHGGQGQGKVNMHANLEALVTIAAHRRELPLTQEGHTMTKPLLFTEQLRASSSSLHAVSNALVVAKLMVAFTDRRVYGLALGSFYHIYLAIEQLLYKCRETDGRQHTKSRPD